MAQIITLAEYQLGRTKLDADFQAIQANMKSVEAQSAKTGATIQENFKKGSAAVGDMSTEVGRLERTMQRIGERIIAAFAIESVLNFGKNAIEAFEDAEHASNQLLFSLNGNIDAYNSLTKQAEAIKDNLGFDVTSTKKVQAYLAAMGLTEEQIKKVTKVSLDLSTVTDEDLLTTATKLAATYEGVKKGLGRYSDEVRTMGVAQLEAGDAVEVLGKKFDGMAAQVDKSEITIRKAKSELKEIGESLGSELAKDLVAITDGFKLLFNPVEQMNKEFGITNQTIEEGNAKATKPFIENLKTLNLQLQDAKERMDEAKVGSDEFNKAQKETIDIDAKIKAALGQKTEAQKKAEEEAKKLAESRKQAEELLLKFQLDAQKRAIEGLEAGEVQKIALINQEADARKVVLEKESKTAIEKAMGDQKLITDIKKATSDDLIAIESERIRQIDTLLTKDAAERKKRNAENLKSDLEESKNNITSTFALLDLQAAKDYSVKISQAKNSKDLVLAEKQFSNAILQNKLSALELELQAEEAAGANTIKTEKEIADTTIAIEKGKTEEKIKEIEKRQQIEREALSAAANLADQAFQISDAQRANETTALQKKYADEQTALDEQFKKKQISQKTYDTRKAALDKEAQKAETELKKKNDKAARDESIFKILIKGTEAVALDYFSGDYVKAAIDAATSLAQIAIIEATPLPQYAKGTLAVKGGEEGRDSVPALLMPGEAVVPTKQARQYNKALGAMLDGRFDEFVLKSYLPALLTAENNAKATSAEKMWQSAQFNDRRIVRAIKESKTDNDDVVAAINKLGSKLEHSNRTSNLYKRYGK